jgi:hypothetical protein
MAYVDTILAEPSLVSYWRLGEASGTFADSDDSNPSVAVGAGVTYNQAGLLTGDSDGAALFNGSTGWIKIANAANLQITSTITMEAWFNLTTLGTAATLSAILINGWFGGSNGGCEMYIVSDGTNGHVRSDFRGGGVDGTVTTAANTVSASATTHVVATYVDATNTGEIYLNGSLSNHDTNVTAVLAGGTGMTSIGARSSDGTVNPDALFATGRIDEVAIYNDALTQGQITAHYTAGTSPASGVSWLPPVFARVSYSG